MALKEINVDYLARVEGEGALRVQIVDDEIEDVQLNIFEPPRFFEAFLEGRHYSEAPDITARICGICPVAYQMTAVEGFERLFGVELDPSVRQVRRLFYWGEWLQSHALHAYLLHAPDFLGYDSAIEMARDHRSIVIGLLLVLFLVAVASTALAQGKPNILLIMADDVGWANPSCYHQGLMSSRTPNIDKLAESGTRLEQFYVQPVCSPTRGALMTGRYPMRLGLQCGVVRPWAEHGLPLDETTLPQMLGQAGYATAIVGKWHLGLGWRKLPDGKIDFTQDFFDRPSYLTVSGQLEGETFACALGRR